MRIRPFEYHAAENLEDVLLQLDKYRSKAKVLAGGTDLIVAMKKKVILPQMVISLHQTKGLDYILEEDKFICIGATTKFSKLQNDPILKKHAPILCEAIALIGSWQIRNVATIGGNLCNAPPAADSSVALLALNARVLITGKDSEKELALSSFFTGPGTTALKPNQLLKEIIIEKPKERSYGRYLKLMRRKAVDLALVSIAFQAEVQENSDSLSHVAIAMGGVAPTPIRAMEAESILEGLTYNDAVKMLPKVAEAAVADTKPISDVRATAEYRKKIVNTFVRRAGQGVLNKLFKGKDVGK